MAFRAPLLGYNTNVRHKGKLYHIQTEDSGIDHPHVITHLFADGGRIVASRKTSYAERVGSEGLQETVKKLMQAQHKAMFIALRDGVYDEDGAGEETADQTTGTRPLPSAPIQPQAQAAPEPAAPAATNGGTEASAAQATAKAPEREPATGERASLYQGTQAAAQTPHKPATFPPNPKTDGSRALFGGDLLSDKSLDEVILNYLAANDKES